MEGNTVGRNSPLGFTGRLGGTGTGTGVGGSTDLMGDGGEILLDGAELKEEEEVEGERGRWGEDAAAFALFEDLRGVLAVAVDADDDVARSRTSSRR